MINVFDKMRLRNAGFIEEEIDAIDKAVDPSGNPQPTDIDSTGWRMAMASRKSWISNKQRKGWTKKDIYAALRGYYKRKDRRTPFDFVSEEYRLGMTGKKITNYQAIRAKRTAANIRKDLPGYATRRKAR